MRIRPRRGDAATIAPCPRPGPPRPTVQVFGLADSRPTQAALRFFKERRVAVHFVDLRRKPLAPGELRRFVERLGARACADEDGRAWRDAGLGYLRMDDAELAERLLADARLLRLPLVRHAASCTAGPAEATWKILAASSLLIHRIPPPGEIPMPDTSGPPPSRSDEPDPTQARALDGEPISPGRDRQRAGRLIVRREAMDRRADAARDGRRAPAPPDAARLPRLRPVADAAHHGRVRRGLRRARGDRARDQRLRLGAGRTRATRHTSRRARWAACWPWRA